MNRQIEVVSMDEITPYENNPRINDNAIDKVVESISEFGFTNPILLDENNVIIAGHTRYEASKVLGLDKVPCIYLTDLSEEQIKAYRLVDNKTSEFANWDFNALSKELAEIGGGIDMSLFDFPEDEFNVDDFNTDFDLPEGGQSEIRTMNFTLHVEQQNKILEAMESIDLENVEKYSNTNTNGNKLYGVICQWEELRK